LILDQPTPILTPTRYKKENETHYKGTIDLAGMCSLVSGANIRKGDTIKLMFRLVNLSK
jgi:hypothetical protein